MREIKFRGKTKQGNWVYGVPVESRTNCGNWHIELVKTINYETDLEYSTYVESEEIDENTLGQYTGLKDKNGKEIYEGDIIKHYITKAINGDKKYIYFCIHWDNEYNTFKPFKNGTKGYSYTFGFETFVWKPQDNEIVGTFYDNPELLEEQK